jgi:uncharacterized repeat protein (TIGR01451 family)
MLLKKYIPLHKTKIATFALIVIPLSGFSASVMAAPLPKMNTFNNPLPNDGNVGLSQSLTISPNSDKGKLVKAFKDLYQQQRKLNKQSNSSASSLVPITNDVSSNSFANAFTQLGNKQKSLQLGKQKSTKNTLIINRDSLGVPTFINGIDKDSWITAQGSYGIRFTPDETFIKSKNLAFFDKYKQLLKLESPETELVQTNLHQDDLGQYHTRFSQEYKGVPIWKSGLVTHSNLYGNLVSLSGKYIPSPSNLSTSPTISANNAVNTAIASLLPNTQGGSINHESRLVIYADKNNFSPLLAWEVELDVSISKQLMVLVNAQTGEIILSFNNIHTENVKGSGKGVLGQTRNLNVWQKGGQYFLHDSSKGMYDPSKHDAYDPDETKGIISVIDARNEPADLENDPFPSLFRISSNSKNSGWIDEGVSAAFNLSEAYDYYKEKHNRLSLDGEGGVITAIVRLGRNYDQAFWNGRDKIMVFGDADKYTSSLDVIAHELTHGVTSTSSKLIYQGQTGAINESLSDIFGEAVERRTFGSNDWAMGTELRKVLRSMSNPRSINSALGRPYPSKMSEYENLPDDVDNGGVHINSSIINYAFYQLAEGLSNSIGFDNAAKVFYRANTTHLLPRSEFSDLRRACIQSADDIFGKNSAQSKATVSAFNVVEIYDTPTTPPPSTGTPSSSSDSVVTLFVQNGAINVGRRENGLNSGKPVFLSSTKSNGQRPAVSGDGSVAAFITDENNICLVKTKTGNEKCFGTLGQYHAVAFSPDDRYISIIFRDPVTKLALPSITIIDLEEPDDTKDSKDYTLKAVQLDDSSNEISYADAMDFNASGRYLIYDALNKVGLSRGKKREVWSIYALDLKTKKTIALVPPQNNANVSYPSLSNINNNLLTFDIFNTETKVNSVVIANASTGKVTKIAETNKYSIPSLTGDDKSLVYSVKDSSTTGYSLYIKGLKKGSSASKWLGNAYAGVVYRRGVIKAPASTDLQISQTVKVSAQSNDSLTFSITLKNAGPDTATKIVVTNNFSAGLKIPNTLPSGCKKSNSSKVECTVSSLKSGGSKSFSLTLLVTKAGELSNAVQVAGAENDSDMSNNAKVLKFKVTKVNSGGSSKSGGGSMPWLILVTLMLIRRLKVVF